MKRLVTVVALAVLALTGRAFAAEPSAPPPAGAAVAPVQKLTFTNKLVGGKKTWVPSEAKAKAGEKLEIVLVNKLPDPHGFNAPGLLKAPLVVQGNATATVMVDPPAAGTYKFNCQLHPAHVGGQIQVQ